MYLLVTLESKSKEWIKVADLNNSSRKGMAPIEYFANITSMYELPYYFGLITRLEAIAILNRVKDDQLRYLVRRHAEQNTYVISGNS